MSRSRFLGLTLLGVAVLVSGAAIFWQWFVKGHPASEGVAVAEGPDTLAQLIAVPPEELPRIDLVRMNLLCAEGLPGAEKLNVAACLATLDQWTERVRSETERHLYRYRRNPQEYENSEGYFRMLMMSVVSYEDCGIRYNPQRISTPDGLSPNDRFFADSRDLFLHGLLGARAAEFSISPAALRPPAPQPLGTCSSMPVLYVAIGRRLGYPLKLVATKAHLFLRWESATERFDLEATGRGMNRYDDDHFKYWPFPLSEEEIRNDGYLKSLTPAEELALFLSLRGHCLKEAGRNAEAAKAYEQAVHFAPESRPYRLLLADAQSPSGPRPGEEASRPLRATYGLPSGLPAPSGPPSPVIDPNPLLRVRQP